MLVPYASKPSGVPRVVGAFVAASLLGVPVSALIVLSALVLGPSLGFLHALGGALASAALAYGTGRALKRRVPVRNTAGV